jgi:hypothetical protein
MALFSSIEATPHVPLLHLEFVLERAAMNLLSDAR